MFFFRSPKMWKSQGERSGPYGGCWSVSQTNLCSLSLARLAVRGRALSCKRIIPSDIIPGRFDFLARRRFCNVSAQRFALIVAPRSRSRKSKQRAPAVEDLHDFTGTCIMGVTEGGPPPTIISVKIAHYKGIIAGFIQWYPLFTGLSINPKWLREGNGWNF